MSDFNELFINPDNYLSKNNKKGIELIELIKTHIISNSIEDQNGIKYIKSDTILEFLDNKISDLMNNKK